MSDFKFSCPACGQNILCDTSHQGMAMNCPSCNASITVPNPPSVPPPPPSPQHTSPGQAGSTAPKVTRTSGLAIASLLCSLTCIGWLPGIIFGHCARRAIRRNSSLEGNNIAKAGLVLGYALMVLTVCAGIYAGMLFVRTTTIIKQALQDAEEQSTNTNSSTMGTNDPGNSDSTNSPKPEAKPLIQYDKPAWTLDLKDAAFPAHPVSGTIHGQDFVMTKSGLQKADIKILGNDDMLIAIHGLGSFEGNEFNFQPTGADDAPSIHIRWKDENGEGKSKVFKSGYAMKLKFGQPVRRKVHGQIYLCLPDDSKTSVAGGFTVTMPKKK